MRWRRLGRGCGLYRSAAPLRTLGSRDRRQREDSEDGEVPRRCVTFWDIRSMAALRAQVPVRSSPVRIQFGGTTTTTACLFSCVLACPSCLLLLPMFLLPSSWAFCALSPWAEHVAWWRRGGEWSRRGRAPMTYAGKRGNRPFATWQLPTRVLGTRDTPRASYILGMME